jgi:hypothetical protein
MEVYQMFDNVLERRNLDAKFRFNSTIKEKTLLEAMSYICKKINLINEIQEATGAQKSLLSSIIQENGADRMLKEFKSKSELLHGVAEAVEQCVKESKEKTEKEVKEKKDNINNEPAADNKNSDQHPLNEKKSVTQINEAEVYDNFNINLKPMFAQIDSLGIDQITEIIADRIADAEGDFLFEAKNNKRLLQKAIEKYGEKISESADPVDRASYNNFVQDIIDDRKRNIYGFVLESVCNEIYKSEELKSAYLTEDSKIDMNEAKRVSKELFTVLEMVHGLNIINFNQQNLPTFLKNL